MPDCEVTVSRGGLLCRSNAFQSVDTIDTEVNERDLKGTIELISTNFVQLSP